MGALTRKQIRQTLGLRTGQPFFRQFGANEGTASANGSTTTLIDTARLLDNDNAWRGSYIYFPATDEGRKISEFDQGTSTVTWLAPLASATVTDQEYEIWSQFAPNQVHEAVAHALRRGWPYFFLTGTDETLIIQDGVGLKYTLPTTHPIRRLCQAYLIIYDSVVGTVTSLGTTTQIIDSGASFTSADVGRWIAVYKDGEGAMGEQQQISSVDSATQVTVSAAFSQAVPVDAKYRKLDKTTAPVQQLPLVNYITDAPEFPTLMWFGQHPYGYEGYPIYLMYEYEYPDLTTEASTTTCPPEFLFIMAVAYMYWQKMASAPGVESETWEAMFKSAANIAEIYIKSHRMAHLPMHRLDHQASLSSLPADYPFR